MANLRNMAIKKWLGDKGYAGGDSSIKIFDTKKNKQEMALTANKPVRDKDYKLGKPLPRRGMARGIR